MFIAPPVLQYRNWINSADLIKYFGFASDSLDIGLWDIDLLDTDLDLLDTHISSRHAVCLQDVSKSWKRFENVFSVTVLCLPRSI